MGYRQPKLRTEFPGYACQRGLYGRLLGVRTGEGETRLSGVPHVRGNAVQQQRSTGDRLDVLVWVGQLDEQRPPAVAQRFHPCPEPTAHKALRGLSRPTPIDSSARRRWVSASARSR